MTEISVENIRQAILDALPQDVAQHTDEISPTRLYLPLAHVKALRLESNLVIGDRGVGKSVWSQALQQSPALQGKGALPQTLFPYPLTVLPGYGTNADPRYPDSDTFEDLLKKGFTPYAIWRGVLCRALADVTAQAIPADHWEATVHWVQDQPEAVAALIQKADQFSQQADTGVLFVFDALDRVSSSGQWNMVDQAIRDLLRLVLQLKGTKRLHAKVFLRTDQYERGSFSGIPDVSKLQSTRIELIWSATDLHGLLWQSLTNAKSSQVQRAFREWCQKEGSSNWLDMMLMIEAEDREQKQEIDQLNESMMPINRWPLPPSLQRDENAQRRLFERLAGPWMGRDRRRGVPYIWIVNHLADGRGQTSPRSFLEAIKKAAEDSQRYSDYPLAIHYESLKRGVQVASETRINELAEDHSWLKELMTPLAGLSVPCAEAAIYERWTEKSGSKPDPLSGLSESLPDNLRDQGLRGFLLYLELLGLITFMRDGRINMPDLYRVGFRLGRKGGVKPALRATQQV
jgi:hypothetical protein